MHLINLYLGLSIVIQRSRYAKSFLFSFFDIRRFDVIAPPVHCSDRILLLAHCVRCPSCVSTRKLNIRLQTAYSGDLPFGLRILLT